MSALRSIDNVCLHEADCFVNTTRKTVSLLARPLSYRSFARHWLPLGGLGDYKPFHPVTFPVLLVCRKATSVRPRLQL